MKMLPSKVSAIVLFVLFLAIHSYAQVGWWKFDDPANLTAAVPGYGSSLVLTGTQTAIAGPSATNGAVTVPKGSYLTMTHGISPNGGGTKVNRYSLLVDFRIAASAWHNFFQVDEAPNTSDGDFFIKPTGEMGTSGAGYSTFRTQLNVWYRLVITVENGVANKTYIDGQPIKDWNAYDIDTRYALNPTLLLFADDDGDDGDIDVAEVAIWDYPLSAAEVAAFGAVSGTIPVEMTSFSAVQLDGKVVLKWETATEKNNVGFTVERKSDNQEWRNVGFVKGVGTSTEKNSYSFMDNTASSGKYSYRLRQSDFDGTFTYSQQVEISLAPTEFKLFNNYPNPFNPSTIISYDLPKDDFISLKIYNITGEMVAELVNEYQAAGKYSKSFNADANGKQLSSGIYFAVLKNSERIQRIKMMLVK